MYQTSTARKTLTIAEELLSAHSESAVALQITVCVSTWTRHSVRHRRAITLTNLQPIEYDLLALGCVN